MHLTDCFIQLIAYTVYFQKTGAAKQPSFEQVKADIGRLLDQSERSRNLGNYSQEDYDLARFAIAAWIDEVILGSPWDGRSQWQRVRLQQLYYNTTDAGEEFFNRLNALGLHQREVREVYFLCLALGFKGRYGTEGDEYLLEQLRSSNIKYLLGSSVGLPSLERLELFPEAVPSHMPELAKQKRRFRFSLAMLIGFAAPAVLFVLLYVVYWFALDGIGDSVLRMVP